MPEGYVVAAVQSESLASEFEQHLSEHVGVVLYPLFALILIA